MIPRGTPDIGWSQLLLGLAECALPHSAARASAAVEAIFAPASSLACLSVRSGLDLVLQALALPRGAEVVVSAITIPAMAEILAHHGLVPVPADLDMATLALTPAALESAITPRARAVLVAHLFGSRMPLDRLAAVARRYGLILLEDCAQAYTGDGYRGHPESDVSLFSFGPIKTATALGGALLRFRDPALLARSRAIQATYPAQPRAAYARRISIFLALKALARPLPLGLFAAACRLGGGDYDRLLSGALRGFRGGDLVGQIRRRPCVPLLRMLARRLRRPNRCAVHRRAAFAARLFAAMPAVMRPGVAAAEHSHWVLPVLSRDPAALAAQLRELGFDATRSASSLYAVDPPPGRAPALAAQRALARSLYLPLYPAMGASALQRLVATVAAFEQAGQLSAPGRGPHAPSAAPPAAHTDHA